MCFVSSALVVFQVVLISSAALTACSSVLLISGQINQAGEGDTHTHNQYLFVTLEDSIATNDQLINY